MDSPTYHIFNLHCPVSIAMDFILDVTPLGSDTFVSGHWHTCPSFNETQLAESRLCLVLKMLFLSIFTQPISESKSVDQHVYVTLSSDCNSISVFVSLLSTAHEGKPCFCVKSCNCNAYCNFAQWFLYSIMRLAFYEPV